MMKMNLKYLYDACIGMHYNKMKYLEKGTEGTKHLVEKYGYDTKQAVHAWRILDFLRAFADNEFTDFIKTIKSRSKFDFGVDVNENDNILTLSTCANNNKYRVVLHAKKL